MKNKVILTSVLIFFLSFLNFQFNLFNVVSDFRFNYFQVESEQFVLDGYLNHKIQGEPLRLGQFSRPSVDMFNEGEKYKPREWFENEFIEGDFWEYKSHFGLQLIIFDFFNGNLLLTQSIASLLLCLIITLIFVQLSYIHSFKFASIFIIILILNPWITPIARNSYFLIFIYLIPFLISLYFSKKINESRRSLFIFLIILYLLLLFKTLIGYDYISTIVLTAMIPIVFYSLKNNISTKKLFINLTLILAVSLLSFSTSVVVHAKSMDNESNPFEWIYYTAAKRLSSNNPEKTAHEACFKLIADQNDNIDIDDPEYKDCYEEFLESLSVSRFNVLSKYMTARHIVPFLGSYQIDLKKDQEINLKEIYYNTNFNILEKGVSVFQYGIKNFREFNILQVISVIINYVISPIIFIIVFILFFYKTIKSDIKNSIFNLFILFPPLSWFILAKGHSFVTAYQLTFFIWYIVTIPYMIAILFSREKVI